MFMKIKDSKMLNLVQKGSHLERAIFLIFGEYHSWNIQNKEMRKKVDSMSRLFLTVFLNSFGGGGLSVFSKAELRFCILFVEPLVCDRRNLYTNCAEKYPPLFRCNYFHKESMCV
jgi:hypothetical protein